jgi:hypothetical protein
VIRSGHPHCHPRHRQDERTSDSVELVSPIGTAYATLKRGLSDSASARHLHLSVGLGGLAQD